MMREGRVVRRIGLMCILLLCAGGCGRLAQGAETPGAGLPTPEPMVRHTAGASCDELPVVESFRHSEIGPIAIHLDVARGAIAFASQMQVNTDGAPDSYHPDDIGITHICNGVSVGASCKWKSDCLADFRQAKREEFRGPTKICFFAMVTGRDGVPLIQREGHPNPGFFISTTALRQPGVSAKEPDAYLDSNGIPFVVIPSTWHRNAHHGIGLGDFAVVLRKSNGALSFAVIGDLGPKKKLGEGSVALQQALGNDPFQFRNGVRRARKGVSGRDVVYVLFPGSRKSGERITPELIEKEGQRLLGNFGGQERLRRCAQDL